MFVPLQNEKRKLLMEHETAKLKDLDEEYAAELREWKAQLKPRKQVRQSNNAKDTSLCREPLCDVISLK